MIYFAQPHFLLLIFLIPFFFIFYRVARGIRRRRIAKFGDPALVNRLTPNSSKRKGWVKLTLFSLAFLFFTIGMARPQIGAVLKKKEIKGSEIMVVLDVSNSMLAKDYSPNRLEKAKMALSRLVDGLKGDRIGLIIFAGESFVQLPITSDYVSAKIFLNSITTESVPVQGTAMGEAITTALRSFTSESENSRAVILITDGENHEDNPVEAAREASTVGARIFCIGVGSPEGKPIEIDGQLMKDSAGEIVMTRLDEKTLTEVAQAGGGIYVRAGNGDFGLNRITDAIKEMEDKEFESVVFEEYDEQYAYFFAIALFFLLLEFIIGSTRNGKDFFRPVRGVSAIVVFFSISVSMSAQNDKKEVRKGNSFFKNGQYSEAEVEYRRALDIDSLSMTAKYNLANALYRENRYEEAAAFLKGLGDSLVCVSPSMASDVYHNAANVALNQKDYQSAVDLYKKSLRLSPDNFDTKSNLAYAQKMLEQQQQQDQQQQDQNQQNQQNQQDQDQQNQDQNQNQNQNKDQEQNQKDQQDQNKDQDKDQNKDQNQDQDRGGQEPKISPETARQMLEAIKDKEKETKEKVAKEKAEKSKRKKKDKNW